MDYEWAEKMKCAVTVCDTQGIILYMNDKAKKTFEKHGDMIGKCMFNCHQPHSLDKIHEMLKQGTCNCYTIQKGTVKKMIYQTPWFKGGEIAGLVELSMEIPEEVPHFIRS